MTDVSRAVRIDTVAGEYFRKGRCAVCGRGAERIKVIKGATFAEVEAKGEEWGKGPMLHKRCEINWDEERGCPIGTPVEKGEA